MKICLINPPILFSKRSMQKEIEIFQPLGLAYIAAMLEKYNYEVSILDTIAEKYNKILEMEGDLCSVGMTYEEIYSYIERDIPDVVGITIPFTAHSQSAFKVASIVKKVDKDIITIVGGSHPSVRPNECLIPSVDFVVIGEGEYTFLELIQKIEKQKTVKNLNKNIFKEVKGIAFLNDGKTFVTKSRPFIEDLDSLPFPARHLLPMQKYFESQKDSKYSRGISERNISIITSRGCPFNCTFCSIHLTMGRKYRARSPKNVVDEIEQLINDYDIKHIEFEDDNLTLYRKRTEQICDEIIQRGLKFKWRTPNGVRADTLDEKLLRKMKKAGCYELWFAPESGVQRVIDEVIHKHISLDKIMENVKICLNLGIKVNCFLVIGLPGETKDEIRKTLYFARKLKKMGASFYINIATPLYGTEFYNIAKEKGYLRDITDENLIYNNGLYIDTPDFTAEEVFDFFKEGRRLKQGLDFNMSNIEYGIKHPVRLVKYVFRNLCELSRRR